MSSRIIFLKDDFFSVNFGVTGNRYGEFLSQNDGLY